VIKLAVGDVIPLELQLADGSTAQFPRALLYNAAAALIATIDLTHVANGRYADDTQTMPNTGYVAVTYIVYSDAGHTTLAAYDQAIDLFVKQAVLDVNVTQYGGQAIHFANAGYPQVDVKYWQSALPNNLSAGRVDAIVSETTALQASANAIKAKTDNLPTTPADQATLLLVKAKTDNLPSDPADESLIIAATTALSAAIAALPTAAQNAIAVLASTVDGTDTLAQAIAIILAEVAGNATIDETAGTYEFKGKDGTTTRLAGTRSGTARTITTRNGS
jgi:hypothetical protein